MSARSNRPNPRLRAPQQERAKVTVAAIVEACARILAIDGWARVSTNRIAQRAGVSIGTLYEYFPHKEAIVEALLDRHLGEAEAHMMAHLQAHPDPLALPLRGALAAWVHGFVALHQREPLLHRRLASEVPISPAVAARVARLRHALVEHVAGVLRAHPEARVRDPQLAAQLIVDTIDALTHRWIVDEAGAPAPASSLTGALLAMLGHYVSADVG